MNGWKHQDCTYKGDKMSQLRKIFLLLLLAAVLSVILALVQGRSLRDIIKFPVFFEVGGLLGWNWLSVTCMAVMVWVGFSKSAKIMSPLNRKNIALVICMTVFPLLFYYTLLDMFPRMLSTFTVYSLLGINPIPFALNYLIWATYNVLPTNLIGFFVYTGFTYAFAWKKLDFKYILYAFIVSFAINALVFTFFAEINIRLLNEANRVLAYYALYLPGWLLFTICYLKMWKVKTPTEEKVAIEV